MMSGCSYLTRLGLVSVVLGGFLGGLMLCLVRVIGLVMVFGLLLRLILRSIGILLLCVMNFKSHGIDLCLI